MKPTWARRLHPGNFRGRLTLWFGLLSLATIMSVGLYIGRIATQEIADFGGQALQVNARSVASMLMTHGTERGKEVRLLQRILIAIPGGLDNPALSELFTLRQQTYDEYAWVGVVDPSGTVRQASQGMLVGANVAQQPWFQAALKGPYVGDMHKAVLRAKQTERREPEEHLNSVDLAIPILDERGRVRGVLATSADWSQATRALETMVTQNMAQRQAEVLLADMAGNIVYPRKHVGSLHVPQRQDPSAPFEVLRWNDGQDYLTSMVDLPAKDGMPWSWRVVSRQPLAVTLEPLRTLHRQLLIFGLLAALVFALITYRLATRVSQPIEMLAKAMRHIERRDRQPVYPEGKNQIKEIRELSASIQSMTGALLRHEAELETLNASLEQQVHERTEALSIANQELERLATVDGLTGVHNRRRFDARIKEAFQLLGRSERGFGLLLLDIDHFKSINDRHGHQAGDEVLRRLGQLLTQSTRVTDFVARYGGEEFVVLLPECMDANEGWAVAEKIRAAVAATPFPAVGQVTVSVGLSLAHKNDASAEAVVTRVDQALYAAKAQGRNRVLAR